MGRRPLPSAARVRPGAHSARRLPSLASLCSSSDFDSLITRQFYYADRTDQIPLLEEAGDQLLFLRPRRFGKSLLLSVLESYYDLNQADRFESLFGNLAIGKNPTAEHSRYFVLKWDFSVVSPVGDGEEIKRNLYRYLNTRISDFFNYYRETLGNSLEIGSPGCHRLLSAPAECRAASRVIPCISSSTNTTTSPMS